MKEVAHALCRANGTEPTESSRNLILQIILQHALTPVAVTSKQSDIMGECEKSRLKILKYLTSSNPEPRKEQIVVGLRCFEVDQTLIENLMMYLK